MILAFEILSMSSGKVWIGTSGWSYKDWAGKFYPETIKPHAQLAHYLKFFDTVEINNSFYRLPFSETFTHWKNSTPSDFLFSVKASRYITHIKKLADAQKPLALFLTNAKSLGNKLGPVLFQLPPNWKLNIDRLHHFLNMLPKENRYVFEFRNPTWYVDKTYELLTEFNNAFCIYELAGHCSPPIVTAHFVYIRLHGPGKKYEGSYTVDALTEWAKKIMAWQQEGKDVYLYFDNTYHANAVFNAIKIKQLINTV